MEAQALLDRIVARTRTRFDEARTLLAFDSYLDLVAASPRNHLRGAAEYLLDMFEHFGTEQVEHPGGEVTRYRLFDAPFDGGLGRVAGQESVQHALHRLINNFVRSGQIDRLILLHGPNGSAKTSIIRCLTRAAEAYSETEGGALYSYNWVFPTSKVQRSAIGFGSGSDTSELGSYALLGNLELDARIPCEIKDHPLLLFSQEDRARLVTEAKAQGGLPPDFLLPAVLARGDMCAKCRQIFDALMITHQGDLAEVLRHVQVERLRLSRRYRRGVAAVEPQMSVDAYSRPVTADRSLASLPLALQNQVLVQAGGALVEGNRGVIEYNDLLKRPVEAFKYLLATTESASASLELTTVFLDALLIASSNEQHLDAFKEYPDWQSFKARMELVPVPYLRRYVDEVQIYEQQIPRSVVDRHIAPHVLEVAARWAVLTRLEPPDASLYPEGMRLLVANLTPLEKLELYDVARMPERLSSREGRDLKGILADLFAERRDLTEYEGRYGASAREVRAVLMNAAQSKRFHCLSPLAVLEELRHLCKEKSVYEFLRRQAKDGYRDADALVDVVEHRYLDQIDEEVRISMGLIEESSYVDLFSRYTHHLSAWIKHEKLRDPVTGKLVDPDTAIMKDVEDVLLPTDEKADDFRNNIISQIGAYSLDHPEEEPSYTDLFPNYLNKLQQDFFIKRRKVVQRAKENFMRVIRGEAGNMDPREGEQVKGMLASMRDRFGYCEHCANDMVAYLMKKRYAESDSD